jgi:hypothetical protein
MVNLVFFDPTLKRKGLQNAYQVSFLYDVTCERAHGEHPCNKKKLKRDDPEASSATVIARHLWGTWPGNCPNLSENQGDLPEFIFSQENVRRAPSAKSRFVPCLFLFRENYQDINLNQTF